MTTPIINDPVTFVGSDLVRGPALSSALSCFAEGTRIATAAGNVEIDKLELGDLVISASGEERPIRHLAHRTFDCRRLQSPRNVLPVRISAHAFGEGLPSRDLVVSPGHSICTKVVSDVLIPAVALINGSTVQQLDVDEVTYWHVELDSHDIVLAENLPAESTLDMGNRYFFAKDGVAALDDVPDIDPASRTHADFCRPFRAEGAIVEAVREQLHEQAAALGWGLSDALDVCLEVDGRRVEPVVRGDKVRFEIPAGATDVWLVSGTARPCDTMKTAAFDDRDLGLCIGALRIDDGFGPAREIAVDDPLLCIGFYGVEAGPRRWTAGRARLPVALWAGCEPGFYLVVEMAATPVPRWQKRAESGNVIALVAA